MNDQVVTTMMSGIGSVGFPIVVTMFLLSKGTQLVTGITGAINDMKVAVTDMKGAIEGLTTRLEAIERERLAGK